ncbi:hypothetical protein KGA66_13010 [Actinocrinis puniceicyclus]|uniref:Uncharacterized protein n=1 Tax=Actinocrinis puniceicyclus TaxID=977794 RepID=A0A8J8BEP8_9ACTN|nr:hypothetical protein [Actinocrinis puniceicyclus]MBS2963969.1 hypothetical protein [Actinocrinis puniceicyclus]
MLVLDASIWGLGGALLVEALDLTKAMKRVNGFPWNQPGEFSFLSFAMYTGLRLGIGAGVAAGLGSQGSVGNGWGALLAGVGAVATLERALQRSVPLPAAQAVAPLSGGDDAN